MDREQKKLRLAKWLRYGEYAPVTRNGKLPATEEIDKEWNGSYHRFDLFYYLEDADAILINLGI